MSQHLLTGREGEESAAKYLVQLGYQLRERNVRFGRDEIDIVAFDRKRKMMVFVEVKTRTAATANYPIHTAVDHRKRACLRRAVGKWTIKHDYDGPGRLDVVCMSQGKVIEHIVDVGSDFF